MTGPAGQPTNTTAAALRVEDVGPPTRPTGRLALAQLRFVRHYLEMVVAMVVGMIVLDPLESLLASALGRPDALAGMAVGSLLMAANMTVAMAGWMLLRRHRLRLVGEMAAGMNVPYLTLLVTMWGAMSAHTLMIAGHVLMFLGMIAVMLARRQEYLHPGR